MSGQRSEVADQGVVLAGVYVPPGSGAQADDLGGLGVDDENAVLDPVAVGLQGVRDPVPAVVADDVVSDEESVHVAGAHLVAMPRWEPWVPSITPSTSLAWISIARREVTCDASMKGRPLRGGDVDNAWEMTCVQEPR